MKLHKIEIQMYADSDEQAAEAGKALNGFVGQMLGMGRAVTAPKVIEAMGKWQNNPLVRKHIVNHFPKIKKQ